MLEEATKKRIEDLKVRILAYLANPARGQMMGHMMAEFGLEKGRYMPDSGLAESRCLDRALQDLRKKGAIRYDKCQWWLV
jgi:hypothetical protein